MESEPMSYISRKECGCLTLAIVDEPAHRREVAKEVAKAIRMGETVERVTCEQVRKMDWKCKSHFVMEKITC